MSTVPPEGTIIPEQEMNRRRRALELADDAADLLKDLIDRFGEMVDELGITATEAVGLLAASTGAENWLRLTNYVQSVDGVVGDVMIENAASVLRTTIDLGRTARRYPIDDVVDRLFAEAPKLTDASGKEIPGQAPAVACVVCLINHATLKGTLSRTPEGVYRMLSVDQMPDNTVRGGSRQVMVEQFFEGNMLGVVAIEREVKAEPRSALFT